MKARSDYVAEMLAEVRRFIIAEGGLPHVQAWFAA
jgi:hypothetical protein